MKEEILLQAERQACMDPALRGKSALVQQYSDQLEKRMHRKQRMWGGDRGHTGFLPARPGFPEGDGGDAHNHRTMGPDCGEFYGR